ncbi:MAG: hypothetical protein RLZZ30_43 [Bacteroidota bacterium]|jgi:GT2 family glycosyltransferase
MNATTPSISIVIPNYNGVELLPKTIESALKALTTSGITDYEIIVSDDASTDGSLVLLEQEFPEVVLVKSERNTGFSGNANRGIQRSSKELICLLNSDVHLGTAYFTAQTPLFDSEETFGVMGLIQEQGTFALQDGAKLPSISRWKIESNKNEFSNARIPTLFLSGANALIRSSYLKEIGGFNELFNPYYAEDVDLGIRAWRRGWVLWYQPESHCYHAQSTTINKLPPLHVRTIAKRNKHFLHFLHLPNGFHWVYVLQVSIKAIFQSLFGQRIHRKAVKQFYQALPDLIHERRKFNRGEQKFNLMDLRKWMHKMGEKRQTAANPS